MTPKLALVPTFNQLWITLGGSFRDGEPTAFYIYKRESIFNLSRLRRWLVRACHFNLKWTSDYSHHCCSIFVDQESADKAADEAASVTGEMYCVKELPVGKMLPPGIVNFGYQKFFHSDINPRYQNRQLDVVLVKDMAALQRQARIGTEIVKSAL